MNLKKRKKGRGRWGSREFKGGVEGKNDFLIFLVEIF